MRFLIRFPLSDRCSPPCWERNWARRLPHARCRPSYGYTRLCWLWCGLMKSPCVRECLQEKSTAARSMSYWAYLYPGEPCTFASPSCGWFRDCCLSDPQNPLTHTLGYVLRGVIEGYLFSHSASLLTAATRTADALLEVIDDNGYLPGRLGSDWSASG